MVRNEQIIIIRYRDDLYSLLKVAIAQKKNDGDIEKSGLIVLQIELGGFDV